MAYGDSSFIPTFPTVLYHKLNGGATDSSASGNNGTATNITYVNGRFGQAANFNGTSSYITVPDSTSVRLTSSYTIGVWLNMSALPTTGNLYNLWYKFTPTTSINGYECLLYNNSGTQQILVTHTAFPAAGVTNLMNYTLPTNRFISFIAVFNGTVFTVYLDGIQIVSSSITAPGGDTGPLEFGRNTNINSRFYNGKMDDIIVENRAWTVKEIQQYYSNAIGRYQTTII